MDDPNSALPSDPTVDESYTRGSRPVQPRTRSGSRTSSNDKDPSGKQNPHIQRLHQGTPRPRTHHNQPQRERGRQRDRTHASSPQRRQMVPAQTGPTYRRSYRLSLAYRIH